MKLAVAGNVLPAVLLLEERGFTVDFDRSGSTERRSAYREGLELVADDRRAPS